VVLEIDWQGALQIKQLFPNAVLVFVLPPSWEELRARLQRRGEDSARGDRAAPGQRREELAQAQALRLRYNQ
jgi:guanylate kinase